MKIKFLIFETTKKISKQMINDYKKNYIQNKIIQN